MGVCSSIGMTEFTPNDRITGQDTHAVEDMFAIGLKTSEINEFYTIFSKFDVLRSGELDLAEFTVFLQIDQDLIAKHVFASMDLRDGSNLRHRVNFRNFVVCLWFYLVRSKTSMAEFAFELIASDHSSHVTKSDVMDMMSYAYGNGHVNENLEKVIDEMVINGAVSKETFIETVHRFPLLLLPAFNLQMKLRQKIMGERFWAKKSAQAERIWKTDAVEKIFNSCHSASAVKGTPGLSSLKGKEKVISKRTHPETGPLLVQEFSSKRQAPQAGSGHGVHDDSVSGRRHASHNQSDQFSRRKSGKLDPVNGVSYHNPGGVCSVRLAGHNSPLLNSPNHYEHQQHQQQQQELSKSIHHRSSGKSEHQSYHNSQRSGEHNSNSNSHRS